MPRRSGGGSNHKRLALAGVTLVGGIIAGFLLRPVVSPDGRIDELEAQLAASTKATADAKARAAGLDQDLEQTMAAKRASETRLATAEQSQTQLASKAADAAARAKETQAVQAKLQAAVEKTVGTVSVDGGEIRLQLVDKVMFKPFDDQLTDRGKQILDRLASTLKEIPDKQVWVHGHTDDQPIAQPPVPKPKRGQKPAPLPSAAVKFATNWELSAARALSVVHYLQDSARFDPTRLAALAFGQYRPVSRTNQALNRRLEIVLYPKPAAKR